MDRPLAATVQAANSAIITNGNLEGRALNMR
jgi:hypothetical protein